MFFAVLFSFLTLSYNYSLFPFQTLQSYLLDLLFRVNAPHLSCVSHPSAPLLLLLSLTCFILFSLSDLFWKICASPLCTALFIYFFFRTLVTTGCVLSLVKRRSVLLHAWLRLLDFSLWNISSLIPQLSRPCFDVHPFPWPQHSKCFFW